MRVAAIYDLHGNLPALEAVLQDIAEVGVDHLVVGGDVAPGPMVDEALSLLLEVEPPVQCIQGNGEVAVLAQKAGKSPGDHLPKPAREAIRWTARQLDSEHERWLAGWPKRLRLQIPELGEVLFCHATPRNENEIFTRLTSEESLRPVFQGLGVPVVVCGHTHMQFDRTIAGVRVVNAGSVGMPFGEPGACWLLLGPGIELRRTEYDLQEAGDRIRASGYPQAAEFARDLLRPRSEEEMLELFARAELR